MRMFFVQLRIAEMGEEGVQALTKLVALAVYCSWSH
jgi:hypothetical protein